MNNGAALLAFSNVDLATFADAPAFSSETEEGSPYDVALALRSAVARDGTLSAKNLFAAYEAINQTFFGGALPPATLLWTAPGSPRTYADHKAVDEHGIRFRIRMSPSIQKYGLRFIVDVVMHEMVHAACHYFDHDGEPGYRGHGPKFAARCNAIGEVLGLAKVAAKGKRAGKPDCAQWPLNVRPMGYYGENDPRVVKAKSPDQGDATETETNERKNTKADLRAAVREAMRLIEEGKSMEAHAVLSASL